MLALKHKGIPEQQRIPAHSIDKNVSPVAASGPKRQKVQQLEKKKVEMKEVHLEEWVVRGTSQDCPDWHHLGKPKFNDLPFVLEI